jgi:serine protease Do
MKIKNIFIVLLIVIVSFGAGIAISQSMAAGSAPKTTPAENPVPEPIKSPPEVWGPETIADIVEKVGDAVVNIDVVKKVRVSSPFGNFERDFGSFGFDLMPEFRDFFRDRIIPQKGAGSGFIIDAKGDILTNEHVVRGADEIKVTLKDGRKFTGKVVGSDSSLDLAIIKVDARDLPSLKLGDSSRIRPGEWVIAIGNPYGFSNTVTAGIISATGRSLKDLGKENLIQTDTPINPGNSGGPLLNLKGEVIGINVAIVAGAQSIGFAIPVNAAKEVVDELIKEGKVVRAWLGIYMRDVDEKIAAYLELPVAEGVVITEVAKDSPAEKMGIEKYDIIRAINDTKIKTSAEISEAVKDKKPGDRISVKVYREGETKILKGKLGERP